MENKNKDNKLWFESKKYGWGWTPTSWEGWFVLLLYIVAITLNFLNIDKFSHSASDTLINLSLPFIINTIFLIIICYAKGKRPRWR
ncbi:MAG: hypothetical protein WAX44_02575 [Minisyncoccia bacterium]